MIFAVALAAALLAAPAPDLAAVPGVDLRAPVPLRPIDAGPFQGQELAGAGLGLLAGDAAVLGAAIGTYLLFTDGVVAATATNYRRLGLGLAATALLLPPLGAAFGGRLALVGPASGAAWKAFLFSLVGHVAALAVGYFAAPSYWAILPVQLATMTAGTSLGLHWGPRSRPERLREAKAEPGPGPVAALGAPRCPDVGG